MLGLIASGRASNGGDGGKGGTVTDAENASSIPIVNNSTATDSTVAVAGTGNVIGLDRESWAQLPKSQSVVWRNAANDAIPLLEDKP